MVYSSKYIEIPKSRVLPFLQTFAAGKGIFQHDIAPCQNTKAAKKFIQENKISMLDWPGNSPDMNPMENLWSVVKKRLSKLDCATEERVVTSVIKMWFHECGVKNICSKLAESMPKLVQEVILEKGTHFLLKSPNMTSIRMM
jgi:transposase